jgi:hypothetical protein
MAWQQRELFEGILCEFAERQARFARVEEKVLAFEAMARAARRDANRRAVAKWNASHPEERRARQRIYDQRKNEKKKAA